MKKAISILSGGLDSFVSTAIAAKKHRIALAITFDYGQRAAKKEISAAKQMCSLLKIPHKTIEIPWLAKITKTSLVNRSTKVPSGKISNKSSAKAVWVPNRNSIFINIAAAFAETMDIDLIITGFNREEAATFPDNSRSFIESANKTLSKGTLKKPRVVSYTIDMMKKDVAGYAIRNRLPLGLCWPCYLGEEHLCGKCESCRRFFKAVSAYQ